MVKAVNTASIIIIIIPNLYTFIIVPKRDLFQIVRTLLPGFIIWT